MSHQLASLGKPHLPCVKWSGDSIGVNDRMGRVYFSSFTLHGRKWSVGDFCYCGDEIFRIVGAFQATASFVGLWRKKPEMEEIQKSGHPYVLVVPLLWLHLNEELVLPTLGRCNDSGHIDIIPQWLGEDHVARMKKLSVRVPKLKRRSVCVRQNGESSLLCRSAVGPNGKWRRPLSNSQRSMLKDGAQELLNHRVPNEWNPVLKAMRVRLVHGERRQSIDQSLPLYYTEDSSDDESERRPGDTTPGSSYETSPTSTESEQVTGRYELEEDGELSPNEKENKQWPRRRTRVSCTGTSVQSERRLASAVGKEESARDYNGGEPPDMLIGTEIESDQRSGNQSPSNTHLEMGNFGDDRSISSVELVRKEDDAKLSLSPQMLPTPIRRSPRFAVEETFPPVDQMKEVSNDFSSPSQHQFSPLAALPSRCESEPSKIPGSQTETGLSGDIKIDSLSLSEQGNMSRVSFPLSYATHESSTGKYALDGSVGTMDYTVLQKRRARVFGTGEIGRLQQAAKKSRFRRRLSFFNSDDGRTLRLIVADHRLQQRPGQKLYCALCGNLEPGTNRRIGHRTSYCCITCGDIPLCTRQYPGQSMSCWTEFHSKAVLGKRASVSSAGAKLGNDDDEPSSQKTEQEGQVKNAVSADTAKVTSREKRNRPRRRRDRQTQPIVCDKRRRKSAS